MLRRVAVVEQRCARCNAIKLHLGELATGRGIMSEPPDLREAHRKHGHSLLCFDALRLYHLRLKPTEGRSGEHCTRMVLKSLLVCGILSSLLYLAMNVFVPLGFDGYSATSQTVSELSAIGAPTRPIWVWLGTVYSLLLV